MKLTKALQRPCALTPALDAGTCNALHRTIPGSPVYTANFKAKLLGCLEQPSIATNVK